MIIVVLSKFIVFYHVLQSVSEQNLIPDTFLPEGDSLWSTFSFKVIKTIPHICV